jgi:hypothetical protein
MAKVQLKTTVYRGVSDQCMKKIIILWLAILLYPFVAYQVTFYFGLYGLVAYLGYYIPLWPIGDPFFEYSSDIGWYYPTVYGYILAAIVYSLIIWFGYVLYEKVRK